MSTLSSSIMWIFFLYDEPPSCDSFI